MTGIGGTIIGGLGVAATQTLPLQWLHLIRHAPRLRGCHPGTLNVRLDIPLSIRHWDIVTPPIAWIPGRPYWAEVFRLRDRA